MQRTSQASSAAFIIKICGDSNRRSANPTSVCTLNKKLPFVASSAKRKLDCPEV